MHIITSNDERELLVLKYYDGILWLVVCFCFPVSFYFISFLNLLYYYIEHCCSSIIRHFANTSNIIISSVNYVRAFQPSAMQEIFLYTVVTIVGKTKTPSTLSGTMEEFFASSKIYQCKYIYINVFICSMYVCL